MAIAFSCIHCGQPYKVDDQLAGREVRCKECGEEILVPQAEPDADDRAAGEEADYSESGQPIYRHTARQKGFHLAAGNEGTIEHVSEHIKQHIGPIASVYHELISDLVHIDLHLVAPTEDKPYHTLITSGMSDLPMNAPEGVEDSRFAELLISLPASWPLSEKAMKNETHFWPIRWLKMLARFPHEYDTWLWYGHTIPNGDPPKPFAANTKLCCSLLLQPVRTPEEFLQLTISDEKTIAFFSLVPLYEEEMNFKLRHGVDALIECFQEEGIDEVLDIRRRNVCKGKR